MTYYYGEENPDVLEKLRKLTKEILFSRSFDLYHEGQIPNVALLLIDGKVELYQKKKRLVFTTPILIGFYELLNSIPSTQRLHICANSKVCLLSRDMLNQFPELDCKPLKAIAF